MTDQTYGPTTQTAALIEALLTVDRLKVKEIFRQTPNGGSSLGLIEQLISPALEWIGTEWEQGRLSLSQVYMSGRLCEEMIDFAIPAVEPLTRPQPRIAIAVLEDYHLLGKRIVYSVLRANGYAVLNYGRLTVDELVEKVVQERIAILLISVLMLPSALRVKVLRERLAEAGLSVKIIVGGAPFRFDEQLWREVGADACGKTASDALAITRAILEETL